MHVTLVLPVSFTFLRFSVAADLPGRRKRLNIPLAVFIDRLPLSTFFHYSGEKSLT